MLHRFSKQCWPFSQNGTERNDKNYGKKTTVPRAFYGTEFGTFLWRHTVCMLQSLTLSLKVRVARYLFTIFGIAFSTMSITVHAACSLWNTTTTKHKMHGSLIENSHTHNFLITRIVFVCVCTSACMYVRTCACVCVRVCMSEWNHQVDETVQFSAICF